MKTKVCLSLLLSISLLVPALAQTRPATPAQTQQTRDDQDDVVRITTNLVQIDAVVTKDGKPVTNLTADDFEIYEDGRKQAITSFAFISNVPSSTSNQPAPPRKEKGLDVSPPPRPLKADEPRRTMALVVDDMGMSAESMGSVRNQLRKFIAEKMQPNDLIAIIRTGAELGALQQFTNDKRLLNRAVDQLKWNACSRVGVSVLPSIGGGGVLRGIGGGDFVAQCGVHTFWQTTRALRFIIDGMGQLPGRKSMVVMSDSLPIEDQEPQFDTYSVPRFSSRIDYSSLLQRLAEKAIRNSVVIYAVDTQGLQYTGLTAADSVRGVSAHEFGPYVQGVMSQRSNLLITRREGGELISRQTGGFQVRNSNGFQLDRILEDQSGYYLIGYRPTDETFNKQFHRIKAKVKRSGMKLRTRFGFMGVSEEETPGSRPAFRDSTNLALTSPFASQDIHIDLTSFFAKDNAANMVIRSFLYIDAKDLTHKLVNGKHESSIEIHSVVFGDNGAVVEQLSRGATVVLSESEYEEALRHGIALNIDMPVKRPGAYQVRVATRDRNSMRIGSAGQFVAVPDLSKNRLGVSGIVLGTEDTSASKADGTMANPGTRRFAQNSPVYFAYMLYNAGATQSLVSQARLFRDGKSVFSGPEIAIDTANRTNQGPLFTHGVVRLGTDLGPGSYYLQIVVLDKAVKKPVPVVQWVDFEIVK
ncbi:MAG TPA: VWA domain-containing protein [Pyrinomonadaceae bacterium]|nr:VWA domain-containing protein [Pyrinomonadaceae bacterium]